MRTEETYAALKAHVSAHFPEWEAFSWDHGPIMGRYPNFRVLRVPPFAAGEPWLYTTIGAWEATRDGDHGFEFFILSPAETPYHVETLAVLTLHHAEPETRITPGRVLDLGGRPWIEGSEIDHFLVTLPYPFGPEFEHAELPDRHVRFLWLVPITRAEAEYIRAHGVDAFEDLAEESGLEFATVDRKSLVCDCETVATGADDDAVTRG